MAEESRENFLKLFFSNICIFPRGVDTWCNIERNNITFACVEHNLTWGVLRLKP
jgi:hypothetical protein